MHYRRAFWVAIILGITVISLVIVGRFLFVMPGQSYTGVLPPLTVVEMELRDRLRDHVRKLEGPRHVCNRNGLRKAAGYIKGALQDIGLTPKPDTEYLTIDKSELKRLCLAKDNDISEDLFVENIEVEIPGGSFLNEIIVIGAHYDSDFYESRKNGESIGTPGANDNATGVAAVLEIGRRLANRKFARTVRLIFFVNEEEPFFSKRRDLEHLMGSRHYTNLLAKDKARPNVIGMFSVETIGYYSDADGSQPYPSRLFNLFFPSVGNFVAFVGDLHSRKLLRWSVASFRQRTAFPSQGMAVPQVAAEFVDGIDWSDHRSFWRKGYPAVMVTDTAKLRYHYYHTALDTSDKIDFDRMSRVVSGLGAVMEELATKDIGALKP